MGERTEVPFAFVGQGIAVLAQVDDRLERDQVEIAIIGLLVACALGVLLVIRTIQKVTTRVFLLVALAAIAGGLWWQRTELENCTNQCSCHVFGQDVRMPAGRAVNCPR